MIPMCDIVFLGVLCMGAAFWGWVIFNDMK